MAKAILNIDPDLTAKKVRHIRRMEKLAAAPDMHLWREVGARYVGIAKRAKVPGPANNRTRDPETGAFPVWRDVDLADRDEWVRARSFMPADPLSQVRRRVRLAPAVAPADRGMYTTTPIDLPEGYTPSRGKVSTGNYGSVTGPTRERAGGSLAANERADRSMARADNLALRVSEIEGKILDIFRKYPTKRHMAHADFKRWKSLEGALERVKAQHAMEGTHLTARLRNFAEGQSKGSRGKAGAEKVKETAQR
jgi:hypothetical protein